MTQPWRLIPSIEALGHTQMALDEFLLSQHILGLQPPIVRFYTWQPVAISLGYHQRDYPDHWKNLTWQGRPIDLVRRPTGGRAVLHQGDLTYAVITSGLSTQRSISYQQICEFLIQGWQSLGVDLSYGQAGRGYIHNPNCFSTATGADLVTATGAKLIGSAQLRRQGAILQHGSMRLCPDLELFTQVFGPIEPRMCDLLLHQQQIDRIISALTTAAQTCFGLEFYSQPLSTAEISQAETLISV